MRVNQVSVFLENRSGRFAEAIAALLETGMQIFAFTIADTTEFGIVRMIVDDAGRAAQLLKNRGFVSRSSEVIAVEIDENPYDLHKLLSTISRCGINVEYTYGFMDREHGRTLAVLCCDQMDDAVKLIEETGYSFTRESLRVA